MSLHSMLNGLVGGALLCGAVAATSGCEVAAYPDGGGDYPSADFVATATPVYYEGHPAYFYHNRWVYRDGNHWGAYSHEPPALAAHRGQFAAPARRNYARPSVRSAGAKRNERR